ncbi:hypothetical protein [Achromobacter pestifer]
MNLNEISQLFSSQAARAEKGILAAKDAGNSQLLCLNARQLFKSLLMQGLIKWRTDNDPRGVFERALDSLLFNRELIRDIDPKSGFDQDLPLEKGGMIARLIDRNFLIDFHSPVENFGRQLDFQISEIMLSSDPAEMAVSVDFSILVEKVGVVAAWTYFLYMEILKGKRNVSELVAEADELFVRRGNDRFYCRGDQTEGGGEDNLIVVDYRLAAILKKVGYSGTSMHQWRW